MGRFCYQSFRLFDPTLVFSSAVLFNPPPSCIIDDRSMENKQQVELKRGGWKLLEVFAEMAGVGDVHIKRHTDLSSYGIPVCLCIKRKMPTQN